MEKKTCNGWHNYETWLFNLWHDGAFTDDAQDCYDMVEACETFTREENAAFALAERIESFAEEITLQDAPESGFLADLIRAGIQEVNFHEIAKHYIQDVDTEQEAA